MPKEENIEVEGVIVNTLPGAVFEVKLPDEFG
jgi:translation initiation factor IF-1